MNGTPINRLQPTFNPPVSTGDDFLEDMSDQIDQETPPQQIKQPIKQEQIEQKEIIPPKKEGVFSHIPVFLREPILIIVIYIILSLDITKNTLSSYIPQIKPTTDGNILFVGILIYAIILAFIYAVAKKFFL